MKKTLSALLTLVFVLSTLVLSGCATQTAKVESILSVDSDFQGKREITVTYPVSVDIDPLSQLLLDSSSVKDIDGVSFEYNGVTQNGYEFELVLDFDSKDTYVSQVSELLSRQVSVFLSQPQSVFSSGTRMVEDFDTSELVSFITQTASQIDTLEDITYDYSVNTVSINGSVFNADSTIDISQREGLAVKSVHIETTNLKDGTFDRTITVSIDNKTYIDNTQEIETYLYSNTDSCAQYCDFTSLGDIWEYKVIYKGLDLSQLYSYTSMILGSETDVYYGDKDNSSTPLSEGLVFEEVLDTFGFMNKDGEAVELIYDYALPVKTTYGDGCVFRNGKWHTDGSWENGVYSLNVNSDTLDIRIPDGIQYAINGINFDLEILGDGEFVRTADFLYSKTQGADGMHYAQNFFESKGALVETLEDDENLICRVICQGTAGEITDELVEYFGSGNFIAYEVNERPLAFCDKTELKDYINLSYMLNSQNANRPIKYTAHSSSDESITELYCDDSKVNKKSDESDVLTVDVVGGQGTLAYNGKIPNKGNIALYIGIVIFFILIAIAVIIYMVYKKKKPAVIEELKRLTAFSETSTEKLREEINKDINEKIEAQRLEKSREELSQLEKLILDEKESQNSDEPQEDNI